MSCWVNNLLEDQEAETERKNDKSSNLLFAYIKNKQREYSFSYILRM